MAFDNIKLFFRKIKMRRKYRVMMIAIYNTLKKNKHPARAIINYILQQAEADEIRLAKRDGITYISFADEEISTFLQDWYMVSNDKQNNGMSNGTYNTFLKTMLNKYKMDMSFCIKKGKIVAEKEIDSDEPSASNEQKST